MAILAPKDFVATKKLPPAGLGVMITGSRNYYWFKSIMPNYAELTWHLLVRGSLNRLFMHHFTFWTWVIHLKSIEYDYRSLRIQKSRTFKHMHKHMI